jgi:hypothetical protein
MKEFNVVSFDTCTRVRASARESMKLPKELLAMARRVALEQARPTYERCLAKLQHDLIREIEKWRSPEKFLDQRRAEALQTQLRNSLGRSADDG